MGMYKVINGKYAGLIGVIKKYSSAGNLGLFYPAKHVKPYRMWLPLTNLEEIV